jgi:nucleotidyltransferase/DNA polymerase involved in DNA repair
VERLLLIDCPELADPGDAAGPDGDQHLRQLARLLDALVEVCPWVDPVRPGVCTLAVRGPARYFGGEAAVLDRVAETVASVVGESPCHLGVAEGVFAAGLAARVGVVVPPGATAAFLSPWPVAVLGTPELGELLPRLGLGTLGALAALPAGDVLARFGAAGARCQRVAKGASGELPGCRTPGLLARLRSLQVGVPLRNLQPGFWGGAGAGDERAAEVLTALQRQLGPEAVLVAVEEGGRGPDDRVRFVAWSAETPPTDDGGRGAPPWPGRLPPPSPSRVAPADRPVHAEVVDARGVAVGVNGRGLLTAPPHRVSVDGGPWAEVTGWSAPWPAEERWWSRAARRSVRLQVTTTDGRAHLLVVGRGRWRMAATYD